MSKLKGWRTVTFNVIMTLIMTYMLFKPNADLPSANDVNGALTSVEAAITAVWGLGNVFLRAITDTPIGRST